MVSLLDVKPRRSDEVAVGDGQMMTVYSISALTVASLMESYPALRAMMAGRNVNVTVDDIFRLAPEVVAAIIVAGSGVPAEASAEANIVAMSLPLGAQWDAIVKITDLTFPQGMGPFVKDLEERGILKAISSAASAGTGKGRGTKSPPPSTNASDMDTPQTSPGSTPPESSPDGPSLSTEESSQTEPAL